ncbi:MAG: hypothetical protein IJU02_03380 [Lachnospiraceae bacterium]|nr:hypothetical protein [Lachnospiraceae bacterium]
MKKKMLCLGMILVLGMMILSGCKIRNYSSKLIDINNGEDGITLGYANFVFKYNQARYDTQYGDSYGAKLWTEDMTGMGQTFADQVKDNIVETLETQYVIKKHADEYKVEITDEDKTKIDDTTKKFMEENSSSALNAMGADEDVVKQMLTDMVYVFKMEKAMTDRGRADGAITDANSSSTYINNLVENWKSSYEFSVDDDLLKQLKVDDLFVADKAKTSNTTNSTQGK